MSPTVRYLQGDATRPVGQGPRVIVHVCNDSGGWGKGFVLALSKRWGGPERSYRAWHAGEGQTPFELGGAQFVQVEPDLWVANVIGQRGTRAFRGCRPCATKRSTLPSELREAPRRDVMRSLGGSATTTSRLGVISVRRDRMLGARSTRGRRWGYVPSYQTVWWHPRASAVALTNRVMTAAGSSLLTLGDGILSLGWSPDGLSLLVLRVPDVELWSAFD